MNYKKLGLGIILGAILGLFCVIGMTSRLDLSYTDPIIIGTWMNRIILGVIISFLPRLSILYKSIFRGLIVGLLVGFTIYVVSNDFAGLMASGVYGIVIEVIFFFVCKKK